MFLHCMVLHSGGLNVISGVNDFLISDKKGKKTSSSQIRKVSTSDLLEVLSLLFNIPPGDLEVGGPSKRPRAAHLFIVLFLAPQVL